MMNTGTTERYASRHFASHAGHSGFGLKPALLVLDPGALFERSRELLRIARTHRLPIVFTAAAGVLQPRPGELALRTRRSSVFTDTGLSAWLAMKSVDTVIVAGAVHASVGATAADAVDAGLRVVIASDCADGAAAASEHASQLSVADIRIALARLLGTQRKLEIT